MTHATPSDLNETFVRNLPDEGPVVMVNLVRFREHSLDGNGTGWDAYTRYSKADMPLLKGVGGEVLRQRVAAVQLSTVCAKVARRVVRVQ